MARAQAGAREETARLAADRRRVLERAQADLERLARRGREELEALLAAYRVKPSPEAVARVRAHLRELRAIADTYAAATRTPTPGAPPEDLRAGEPVLVVSLGQRGIVQAPPDPRGEVEVQVGTLKVRVPRDDLRRVESAGAQAPAADSHGPSALDKMLVVPSSIHLRGKTIEEALAELDKYLDDATLAGLPRVTVIHGKGTGALRRAVREYLSHHPEVASFRLGGDGEGGSGATVVELAQR